MVRAKHFPHRVRRPVVALVLFPILGERLLHLREHHRSVGIYHPAYPAFARENAGEGWDVPARSMSLVLRRLGVELFSCSVLRAGWGGAAAL